MDLKEFWDNLTPEQIEEGNKRQLEESERVYNEFKDAYEKGICSLCGKSMNYFNKNSHCFHWFLKPNGVRKNHFKKYLSKPIGFFRLDSYIRWVANMEKPITNISDLKDEMNPQKVREYTVVYKNIEWSVSIGKTDLEGHKNSRNANFPHFHLQMIVDSMPFIRFNDFHIPLSDEDVFIFKSLEQSPDKVVFKNLYGEGVSVLEDESIRSTLFEEMEVSENEENADFNITTMFQMPKGESISGEMLGKIINESKRTKVPVGNLLNKYFPNSGTTSTISPGKGVPEIKKRNKR